MRGVVSLISFSACSSFVWRKADLFELILTQIKKKVISSHHRLQYITFFIVQIPFSFVVVTGTYVCMCVCVCKYDLLSLYNATLACACVQGWPLGIDNQLVCSSLRRTVPPSQHSLVARSSYVGLRPRGHSSIHYGVFIVILVMRWDFMGAAFRCH